MSTDREGVARVAEYLLSYSVHVCRSLFVIPLLHMCCVNYYIIYDCPYCYIIIHTRRIYGTVIRRTAETFRRGDDDSYRKRGMTVARAHHIMYTCDIIIHVDNSMSFCRIARQTTNANACGPDEIFLMEGGRWIHTELCIMHNSFIILFIILRHTMQRLYTYIRAYSSHLNTICSKVVSILLSKDDGAS